MTDADEGAYERPTRETHAAEMRTPYDIIKRNIGGVDVSRDSKVDYLTMINTNSNVYLSPDNKLDHVTTQNKNSNVYDDITDGGSHPEAFDYREHPLPLLHNSLKHESANSNYIDIEEENIYDRIPDDDIGERAKATDPESVRSAGPPRCTLVRVVAIILSVFLVVAIVVIAVPVWLRLNNSNNADRPSDVASSTISTTIEQTTSVGNTARGIVVHSTMTPEKTTRSLEALSTKGSDLFTTVTHHADVTERTTGEGTSSVALPEETTSRLGVDVTTTPRTMPTTVRKGCVDGWDRQGDHCYKFFSEAATWEDSRVDCESLGAHLLTIDTTKEQLFLQDSYVPQYGPETPYWEFWLGGRYEAGSWRWITTNDPIAEDWQTWSYNGPDYHVAGDCLTYRIEGANTNDMFDYNCAQRRPYVCEHQF